MKHPFFLLLLVAVAAEVATGAGECGSVPVQTMALRLASCASAAQNTQIQVPAACCSAVEKIGQTPACLCAVMLSDTAKSVGVKPEIAVTIPKRCNIASRPVGYKCGAYTLP